MKAIVRKTGEVIDVGCVYYDKSDKKSQLISSNEIELIDESDLVRLKAIESFKENCPCWSRFEQDRICDECIYLRNFCIKL